MSEKRVVVTGMAAFTPMSTSLQELWDGLMTGKSAVSQFSSVDTSRIHGKVGGDFLASVDLDAEMDKLKEVLPAARYKYARKKIFNKAPFATKIGLVTAIRAWEHAGLGFDLDNRDLDPFTVSAVLGGHNFNQRYVYGVHDQFLEEPEFIDGLYALIGLDTYVIASIADILGVRGPCFTVGGACASTNIAMRDAIREIRHDGGKVAVVAGSAFDFGDVDMQAMCLIDAITYKSFNEKPAEASRPYDKNREGFVPTWGCGTMIVEELDHALARGATIHAEVIGVLANCDANHLPQPSTDGQTRLMTDLLRICKLEPEKIDYINAHATSTPMGDLAELRAIENVFGDHAKKLKINATKSMLGHTCWSAPNVESIAAIMQMNAGKLHQSINIDELDPEVKLDVCAEGNVDHEVNYLMKNSFGFSGINCCSVLKRYEGPGAVTRGNPF